MEPGSCIFYTGKLAGTAVCRPMQAHAMLDEMFTHSDGLSKEFFQELYGLGIVLPEPTLRVISISPGPGESLFDMQNAREFIEDMCRMLPEHLELDGLFFYINSSMQGLVSVPDQEALAQLYHAMEALVRPFPTKSRPHVAISNAYDALECISRACVENQEAHLFERFLTKPIDVILQPRDFFLYNYPEPGIEVQNDEQLFGQLSQRIANAIILGDKERMHGVLDEALEVIITKFPRVSGVHMRAIHFCKPLEMTLVGADLIDRLFVQQLGLVQRVIETESEAQLRASFHDQLDAIWAYALQRKKRNHDGLMHRIVDYVEQNLRDSTLSIQTIAESFHMQPAQLSAEFREYYHETLPGLIHQRRVAYMKNQLRETNRPIREICFEAGYISVATMNRAFLKLEGIYPGQYRKKFQRNQDAEDT